MSYIRSYVDSVTALLQEIPEDAITRVVDSLKMGYLGGKQLFIMGNGGSAATASHMVNDFQKCIPPVGGRPYRAMALTDSVPLLLAWANDTEYGNVFSEQLRAWVQPGDVVIGISGSGNSENVIRAIDLANESGAITIAFSAYDGGKLRQKAKFNLHVPTFNMQQAEDLHMILLHLVFSCLREDLAAGENLAAGEGPGVK